MIHNFDEIDHKIFMREALKETEEAGILFVTLAAQSWMPL
jgi:hypothetical protein